MQCVEDTQTPIILCGILLIIRIWDWVIRRALVRGEGSARGRG